MLHSDASTLRNVIGISMIFFGVVSYTGFFSHTHCFSSKSVTFSTLIWGEGPRASAEHIRKCRLVCLVQLVPLHIVSKETTRYIKDHLCRANLKTLPRSSLDHGLTPTYIKRRPWTRLLNIVISSRERTWIIRNWTSSFAPLWVLNLS